MQFQDRFTRFSQETLEDFRYGQVVIAVARWFLLGLGMFSLLYRADAKDLNFIALGVGLIWLLTLFNAYLHGRVVVNRPVGKELIILASVLDIAIICILVGIRGGFGTYFFIFYYPAILAFSLVFPPALSFTFSGAVIFIYSMLSFFVGEGVSVASGEEERVLIARLVMMAAISAVGTFFWRVERQRRRATVQTQVQSQMEQFRQSLRLGGEQAPRAPAAPQVSSDEPSIQR